MKIALKTLRNADATRLYHLKQEFRSLAGIVHRNLVTFYELVNERDQWFLTMELVNGVPFVQHIRPASIPEGSTESPTLSLEDAPPEGSAAAPTGPAMPVDYDR